MDVKAALEKAKKIKAQRDKLRADPRFQKVMAFFRAKGLIIGNAPPTRPPLKLQIPDVLWVAEKLEPRVFEILPAALLNFPNAFLQKNKLPQELRKIVEAIRKNQNLDMVYHGIPFEKFQHWARFELKDRRTKPIQEKRVMKSFRLSPKVVQTLQRLSLELKKAETEIIEDLILDRKKAG